MNAFFDFLILYTLPFVSCLPAWGGFDNCRLFPIFPKVMEILTLTSGVWWQKVVAREDSQPSSFASLAKNVTPDCRRWPRMNFCVSRDPCICDEFNGAKFIYKQEPIEVFYYYVCNVPAVILLTPLPPLNFTLNFYYATDEARTHKAPHNLVNSWSRHSTKLLPFFGQSCCANEEDDVELFLETTQSKNHSLNLSGFFFTWLWYETSQQEKYPKICTYYPYFSTKATSLFFTFDNSCSLILYFPNNTIRHFFQRLARHLWRMIHPTTWLEKEKSDMKKRPYDFFPKNKTECAFQIQTHTKTCFKA